MLRRVNISSVKSTLMLQLSNFARGAVRADFSAVENHLKKKTRTGSRAARVVHQVDRRSLLIDEVSLHQHGQRWRGRSYRFHAS
jgi:hypothetical protein